MNFSETRVTIPTEHSSGFYSMFVLCWRRRQFNEEGEIDAANSKRDKIPWTIFAIMMMLKYRCHQSSSNLVLLCAREFSVNW